MQILVVFFAATHGFNGLRVVVEDYSKPGFWQACTQIPGFPVVDLFRPGRYLRHSRLLSELRGEQICKNINMRLWWLAQVEQD